MAARELNLQPDWIEFQLTTDHVLKAVKPFALWALGLIVSAFIFGVGIGPHLRNASTDFSLTLDIPPLPVVEPMTYKPVSMDIAREINEATPLTKAGIPGAAPYFFFGSEADHARAIDCLAATVYYEAGNEAIEGQMAVVQVVLNRARHPAYPKTICGVVFQGHERRTGCQFSYTCDGSMVRRKPPAETWKRFRGMARAMTNGLVYTPVGLATHYHTDWVLPYWSAKLDKVRVERTHLFFRYHGYWGSPKAFVARTKGTEPVFAKLGSLSEVHSTGETLTPEDAVQMAEPMEATLDQSIDDIVALSPDRVAETIAPETKGKEVFILYVDPLLEPEGLTAMAKNACGDLKRCKVLAWADPGLMPRGLPISSEERASMAFTYQRDPAKGLNGSKWNCVLFPRDRATECLNGTAARE
jgi:spore germination cell wall hydrolase CwlJ-like protein